MPLEEGEKVEVGTQLLGHCPRAHHASRTAYAGVHAASRIDERPSAPPARYPREWPADEDETQNE